LDLDGSSTAANAVSGVISNGGGFLTHLTKNGTGRWVLSNVNTYTGPTQVNGGVLQLGATGSIATSSAIRIGAGAKFNTTEQASFVLSGAQPVTFVLEGADSGSAGRIEASGLVINSAVVNFTVNGTLDDAAYVLATYTSKTGDAFASVTPPSGYSVDYAYNGGTQIALVKSGYDAWLSQYPNLADKTEGGDSDNDGVLNLLEYVLNGNPEASSLTMLPTLDAAGANFLFQFTRRIESAEDTIQVFEYSTNLNGWTPVNITGTAGASVSFGTPSAGLQTVTVTIPKGNESKMFGRLKVTK
jgi:autotransporter-associated beta strand protein